jgi:hypothetical protein
MAMKPKDAHKPGTPTTECPSELETLADLLKHQEVIRTGITCTEELDSLAFPVVYVNEPDEPIRAQRQINQT